MRRRKMDGKGKEGWSMLRCAAVAQDNNDLINRTMLRFRPIAPKPATNDTVSGNVFVDNKNLLLASKRSKRKYVRVRKNNGYRRRKDNKENNNTWRISTSEETEDRLNKNAVTLQLLPDKSTNEEPWCNNGDLDHMVGTRNNAKVDENNEYSRPNLLNFQGQEMINGVGGGFIGLDRTVEMPRRRVVAESWVTVESVIDTCMETRGLGCTDFEGMKVNLEKDACPGFISDGLNRVLWLNEAYKRMVMTAAASEANNHGSPSPQPEIDIVVWLVIKDKLPRLYSSFTTKVRLQYTWQTERYSRMVPCDVFRLMDGGGFAWRLDVEAALSLGR